jgi:hypothetical protein
MRFHGKLKVCSIGGVVKRSRQVLCLMSANMVQAMSISYLIEITQVKMNKFKVTIWMFVPKIACSSASIHKME